MGGNGLLAWRLPCHKGRTHRTRGIKQSWRVSLSICRSHFTNLPAIQVRRFYEMLQGIMNNSIQYMQLLARRWTTDVVLSLLILFHQWLQDSADPLLVTFEFVLQLVSFSELFFTPNCIIAFLNFEAVKQSCALHWQCNAKLNQRWATCSSVDTQLQ